MLQRTFHDHGIMTGPVVVTAAQDGLKTGRAVERGSAKGGRQPEPTKLRNQSYRHLFGEKGDGVNDTNGALPSLSTRYSHCARIAPKSRVEIAR